MLTRARLPIRGSQQPSSSSLPSSSSAPSPSSSSPSSKGPLFVRDVASESLSQRMATPLEWKFRALKDGTAVFKHPTYEELVSSRMAQLAHFRLQQRRQMASANKMDEDAKVRQTSRPLKIPTTVFGQMKQKRIEDAKAEKLKILNAKFKRPQLRPLTDAHMDAQLHTAVPGPDAIARIRQLIAEDPTGNTPKKLAKEFGISAGDIETLVPSPAAKVLQDKQRAREGLAKRRKKSKHPRAY